jgi:regulator of protease activity HflC (stomatin/prohibitin superfamily)
LILGCSITFVPTGYIGIRTAYGQISGSPVSTGIHFHVPFVENIHKMNCKQQEMVFDKDKIWSETSERTEVYAENIVVDYQINAEYGAWIWSNIEEWDTNLVKRTSVESGLKAAFKQYNDTDVTDRSKIEKTAKEYIQKSLNTKYNNQVVTVISVTISNINFSDAYNDAIEKKAQAKLSAEEQAYENQKTIDQAKAEAEKQRIEAQGKAEAKIIEAEAEAEANEKISKSITPEVLQREWIQKWNGKTPSVVSDSDIMYGINSNK